MAGDDKHFMPPTLMGTVYWKDHVVAVIDEHEQAEQAVAELVAAGTPAEDARAWRGSFVMENHRYYLEHRNLWQRIGSALPSDEAMIGEAIGEAAARGASIITVRAPGHDEAEAVRAVLSRHGAARIVHFRANTVVEL